LQALFLRTKIYVCPYKTLQLLHSRAAVRIGGMVGGGIPRTPFCDGLHTRPAA